MSNKLIFITIIFSLVLIAAASMLIAVSSFREYPDALENFREVTQAKKLPVHIAKATETNKNDYSCEINNIYKDDYIYSYAKEDVIFISYLDSWNYEGLISLADELFSNTHGEEIKNLEAVLISDANRDFACSLCPSLSSYEIPLSIPGFLPGNSKYLVKYNRSIINIYGADAFSDPKDFAMELSRAYGELFVDYYIGLSGTDADKQTKYYKIRAKDDSQVITDTYIYDDTSISEKWCLKNIAVDDYVYFLGSSSTREVCTFYDSSEKHYFYLENKESFDNPYYKACRNGTPHSNILMKMPHEVDGLAEYFFSFVDQSPPEYTLIEPLGTLNLRMTKCGNRRYYFQWDQPYTEPGILYTLIGYDMDDNAVVMVRTVKSTKSGWAFFGVYLTALNEHFPDAYLLNRFLESGSKMKFRVSITFPDSSVVFSDPLIVTY